MSAQLQTAPPFLQELGTTLYDADADQVIPSHRIVLGPTGRRKRYRVSHVFGPLTDEVQFEYFKRSRMTMERDIQGSPDIDIENDSITAAIYLHDQAAKRIDGIDMAGIRDWKSAVVSVQSKLDFVNECLLYCSVAPAITDAPEDDAEPEDAVEGELCPVDTGTSCNQFQYHALVRFNGQEILTRHFLRGATGVEMMRYSKVSQKSQIRSIPGGRIKTIIPSKAEDFVAFYDAMIDESQTVGFAGRVPVYVKKAVAELHLSEEEKRLRGN